MKRVAALVCIAWLGLAKPAFADPMTDAYNAYSAAFAAKDFIAAERHGRLALEAAEAKGSRQRALLAYNLGYVLAELERYPEAKAAAERALEHIAAGAQGDARLARLLQARAALRADEKEADVSLAALLEEIGAPTEELAEEIYLAGMALGIKGRAEDSLKRARVGFAAALAAGSPELGVISEVRRILALIGLGSVELMLRKYQDSSIHLNEALVMAAPLAPESVGPEPTAGETLYATALAWRRALHVFVSSIGHGRVEEMPDIERQFLPSKLPSCARVLAKMPEIKFPSKPRNRGQVGAVVVRLGVDDDGKVTAAKLVATVPVSQGFDTAVIESVGEWAFKPKPKTEPNCRMRTDSHLVLVGFAFQ